MFKYQTENKKSTLAETKLSPQRTLKYKFINQSNKKKPDNIPPSFIQFKGFGPFSKLYLPQGTPVKLSRNKVLAFDIGNLSFSYDMKRKGYYSGEVKFTYPKVEIENGGLDFGGRNYDLNTAVKMKVTDTPADNLQMIQTVKAIGFDNKFSTDLKTNKADYNNRNGKEEFYWTDGGIGNPKNLLGNNLRNESKAEPVSETLPYYYKFEELESERNMTDDIREKIMVWEKAENSGTIWLLDYPKAVLNPELFFETYFETSVVAQNWMGSGKDVILASFKWGYQTTGQRPIKFHKSEPELVAPSDEHLKIIGLRYGNYLHDNLLNQPTNDEPLIDVN